MSGALAKLGYAYAEEALARHVDSNDHAIEVRGVKVSAQYMRATDGLEIYLAKDGDTMEFSGREIRDVMEVVRGMVAADDNDPDLDPLAALIASRTEMVDMLRLLRSHDGECLGDHSDWLARIDAILANSR